ncbi:MFS transporter [Nonomuraea turkmeniaca]|uniref:MFS transporter n=1 Tax=Nonomuraea turkmeniaca TaxID=103838 RepID=A0A5S4FVV8_9ACTN|nr:MFS transporter [Nonomuraea turkmeniaca]TMR24937.1 MFS transporter [Nonomuraea turkmeniaca]
MSTPSSPIGQASARHSAARPSFGSYLASVRSYPSGAWKAAAAVLIAMGLSPATIVTATTFVVGPIAEETGWSVPAVVSMFSMPLVIGPLLLPLTGRLVDRLGARRVALPMMLLYGLATMSIWVAGARHAWLQTVLIIAAICGFSATMGVVFKVIAGWFTEHRGAGFSLLLGSSVGLFGAAVSPVSAQLVGTVGWRGTYLVFGAAILVISLPAQILLLREAPGVLAARGRDRSAAAASTASAASVDEEPGVPSVNLSIAVRSRAWILYTLMLALVGGAIMAVRVNAEILFNRDHISVSVVALSVSTLLIASIIGQAAAGFALDRSRSPRAVVPYMACVLVGLLLVANAGRGVWLLYAGMALLGVASGAEGSIGPFLSARYFGLRAFGQIQGLTLAIVGTVMSLVPILVSAQMDQGVDIDTVFHGLEIAGLIAIVMAFLLPAYPEPASAEGEHAVLGAAD